MITLSHIEKNYGLGEVLLDFSMTVNPGEKVGLIGANGSGKSTILKLISGLEEADKGIVAIGRNLRIGYLAQIPERHLGETVEERLWKGVNHLLIMEQRLRELESLMASADRASNKIEGYMKEYAQLATDFENQGGYTFEQRIKQIIQGLGLTVPFSSQVMDLSGGEMARLQLAVLLLSDVDVILLDEPTNHLDFSAITWLEEYINHSEGTVIIISHDRYFLDHTIQRIVEVKHGKAEDYSGNYSYYLQEREIRHQLALKEYENQQKEIQRKEEAIKRLRIWANQADNEMLYKRAKVMERQLEKMEKVDRPLKDETRFQLKFGAERSGKEVVTLRRVTKNYSNQPLFNPLDLQIFFGQRIGLIGPNGAGKSTILKMIMQEIEPDHGQLTIGASVQIGYFEQHQDIVEETETVLDAFRMTAEPMSETSARNTLAYYGFTGDSVFKLVKDLSGGERSRFILMKMVHSQVNLLILDEPTNHLDLPSIEILEESLQDYTATLLVVSHDRYFLNNIVDQIYALEEGELVYYPGNYDYYQMKLKQKQEQQTGQIVKKAKCEQKVRPEKRNKEVKGQILSKRFQKELAKIEESIAGCEDKIGQNNNLMTQSDVITNYQYLQELKEENDRIQEELEHLWAEWEEICVKLEDFK